MEFSEQFSVEVTGIEMGYDLALLSLDNKSIAKLLLVQIKT